MSEPAIAPQNRSVLRVEGVSFAPSIGAQPVKIKALQVRRGDLLGVIHPTSFDRAELRRTLLGLAGPVDGEVELLGKPLAQSRRATLEGLRARVGWVRDPPLFLNNVPLFENVILPLRFHTSLPEDVLHDRGQELFTRLGSREIPTRIPLTYSYNRRRISSLVRALLPDVALLVVESVERTFLERDHRQTFLREIRDAADRGTAIVLMTTPTGRLPHLCREFLFLTPDGGAAQGDIDTLSRHEDPRIRKMAGRKAFWLLGSEGTLG